MKTWKKYREYLLSGEWHIHTSYTDGKNTVMEVCEVAKKLEIPLIAFTEHVRKEIDYDFNQFLSDVEKAKNDFPEIIILSGIEAKVLPNGDLDVDVKILKEVDYPIFSFHDFPNNLELYIKSLKKVIENKYVNAWAHPGLFLEKRNLKLPTHILIDILKSMKNNDVLLEVNMKYKLPKKEWIDLAIKVGVEIVKGSDVHDAEMLGLYRKLNLGEYYGKGNKNSHSWIR